MTRLGRLMNISTGDDSARGGGELIAGVAYEDYLAAVGYIQRFDKPGNLDSAVSALQNAVRTDPRFALGFARLAQVYILKYELDSDPKWLQLAEPYCRRAVELDDRVPLTFVALGKIHEYSGNADLAISEFQRALSLDPRDVEALAGIAHSYQNADRIPEAEAAFVKAAALRPEDWSGYNDIGNFYDRIGRHKEAITQLRKALSLTQDNSAVYLNLANALMNSGDPTLRVEAEKALNKSIAIHPTYEAYAGLGLLLLVQHRFREAIDPAREATQLNDQSYDAWNNLTIAYEWVGDIQNANSARKRAIDLLQRAIKLNPQDAEAQATLAALLAKNGIQEKALEGVTLSLALSPHSGYVLSEAVDTYELLGKRSFAVKYLKLALQNGVPLDQLNVDPEIQSVLSDPAFRTHVNSTKY